MSYKRMLPEWLEIRYKQLDENPRLNDKQTKISDFLNLIECIWCISSAKYQERIWVNHETQDIVDSYDDSTMYFGEDADSVLRGNDLGRIEMTKMQYNMLDKLNKMVDEYDMSDDRPDTDKEIVNDPKWHAIRDYAKLVYEELIK